MTVLPRQSPSHGVSLDVTPDGGSVITCFDCTAADGRLVQLRLSPGASRDVMQVVEEHVTDHHGDWVPGGQGVRFL